MIGIPIMLIAGAGLLVRTTTHFDPGARAVRELGPTDALVTAPGGEVSQDVIGEPRNVTLTAPGDPTRHLTAARVADLTGGRVLEVRSARALVRTAVGALSARVREFDLRDPRTAGLGTLVGGRAPRSTDEVAVSAALIDEGFAPGRRVRIEVDGHETRPLVVGVVRNAEDLTSRQLVGLSGAVIAPTSGSSLYLVDTPDGITWPEVRRLNSHGLLVKSRYVIEHPPPRADTSPPGSSNDAATVAVIALAVVSILLEVVLLAGPAFAVGARRQSRQLALLVATGGTPEDIRRIVLAQAGLLGLGAALGGIALAVVGTAATLPLWSQLIGRDIAPLHVVPLDLVVLAAVGTLAALVAAYVPARQAARQDTVLALAGRRGETRTRRGWPVAGGCLVGIGLATVLLFGRLQDFVVPAGTLVLVAGAIMLTPAVVGGVGRFGTRLPLSIRLAARDSARHRSRTAPAVAAIMGAVTGVTALAIGSASDFAESRRDYVPSGAPGSLRVGLPSSASTASVERLERRIAAELPGSHPVVLQAVPGMEPGSPARTATLVNPSCTDPDPSACSGPPEQRGAESYSIDVYGMAVGTPETVAAASGGRPLTANQRRVLAAGGVLVPSKSALLPDGTVEVATFRLVSIDDGQASEARDVRRTRLPAAVLPGHLDGSVYTYFADATATPATARRLGLTVIPHRLVVPPGRTPVSAAQEDLVGEIAAGMNLGGDVYVERGFVESYTPILLILAGLGGLIVLVGTATATALALDDARPDTATLAAIGAAPRTRRRLAMAQAAVIGVLGVGFGIAVGVIPGIAVTWPLTAPSPGGHIIDVPWTLMGILAIGVPVLAMLGAGLFARSNVPMIHRAE